MRLFKRPTSPVAPTQPDPQPLKPITLPNGRVRYITELDRDFARSFEAIPASLISDEDRAAYIARALRGESVYAYHGAAGWNVWEGDRLDEQTGYLGVRHYLGEEAS